jgi:integrase
MEDINFADSVKEWCIKHYPSYTNSIISTLINTFSLLYNELQLENDDPNIADIQELIVDNSNDIEKAFFNIFIKLRESKSDSSILTMASILRKALELMGMDKARLKISPKKKEKQVIKQEQQQDIPQDIINLLPTSIRNLPHDNLLLIFIVNRFGKVKENSNCKSIHAKKIMLRYWVSILKQFGSFEDFDPDLIDFSLSNIINIAKPVIINDYYVIYLHHLFYGIHESWIIKIKELKTHFDIETLTDDKDGDKDTLSVKQQENIWKACQTTLEKLVISLLFTTGLRVGGLCNIKINDIYDSETKTIKDFGSTLEKRNKTRRFPIFDMVKKPLSLWLEENHMVNSIYLFPNARDLNKPRSTMSFQSLFKEIAKRAGYEGSEIHIHSARHSVAHNLLEAGNSMEEIGKYLGHSNPATTAKFYANLSTKETVDRMNTECIGGSNMKDSHKPQLPQFDNKHQKDKHVKKSNGLRKLADIDIGGKSVNEEKLLAQLEKIRSKKK